jgi:predicted adenylyl cyclase CyaB
MTLKNYEFKAAVNNIDALEQKLLKLNPVFKGEDHQIDTYFNVKSGRLKLREGIIENALIYYERPDISGAKQSDIILYRHNPEKGLKELMIRVHGIKAVVDKRRRIYFIDNVKFHFDRVESLGTFIEVEAIAENPGIRTETLKAQCDKYIIYFDLHQSEFISKSYCDLIPGK